MTRESKLALMIAVTLILLVGVLLSDHLSGARTAEFDEPAARQPATPVAGLPGAGEPLAALPLPPRKEPALAQQFGEPENTFEPIEIPQGFRAVAMRGAGLLGEGIERITTPGAAPELRIPATDQPSEPESRFVGIFVPVDPASVTLPPRGDTPVKRMPEPTVEPARPQTTPANQPARQTWRTHTVVEGDSLYRLAARYLGDGKRWPELQKLNDDVLRGSENVQLGMVLKIAPEQTAQSQTQTQPQTRSQSNNQSQTRQPNAPRQETRPEPKHRTYVVLKGDSLGKISQSLLGTSRRMNEIVELNALKDPDDIRVGQTLRIPAR